MKHLLLFAALLAFLPTQTMAGSLDAFYLQRFEALYHKPQEVAGVVTAQADDHRERCLTPLYHQLTKDWQKLSSETQKTLAAYLALPILTTEQVYVSSGGHFKIHYAGSGTDAPPSTTWVQTVAATFEDVYNLEVTQDGYKAAPTATGVYDIYLKNLGTVSKEFGETVPGIPSYLTQKSVTSYIIIDNDFSSLEFGTQISGYSPLKALQITAAHEYHHAIQFGYNYFFDIWYGEASATWMEDEVYDSVNQLYNYLPQYMQNTSLSLDVATNVSTGGGYGRWIFNRYLAERYPQGATVKAIWEQLGLTAPTSDADIPMLPVIGTVLQKNGGSLSEDFFSFARKVYLGDWSSHTADISLMHPAVPKAEFNAYPVNQTTAPSSSITLNHYAFAFYRFTPSSSAPQDLVLHFSQPAGIRVTAYKKTTSGQVTEYSQETTGGDITVPSFNTAGTAEVILLICNNGSSDNLTLAFNTDGSPLPAPSVATTAARSSSKSGCFIATAAYGSYLHPKVALLRQFRDKYLLTSGPGRAFVSFYYWISPPIAAFIADHESARAASRLLLWPVVLVVENGTAVICILITASFFLVGKRIRQRRV